LAGVGGSKTRAEWLKMNGKVCKKVAKALFVGATPRRLGGCFGFGRAMALAFLSR
jgi:hypothetical protein